MSVAEENRMRLLIVEDDRKLAEIEARTLRGEGFIVDVANDGLSGRELLATHQYDLLIIDLMLPLLSGSELLRYRTQVRRIIAGTGGLRARYNRGQGRTFRGWRR